jgi:hypothetical protein
MNAEIKLAAETLATHTIEFHLAAFNLQKARAEHFGMPGETRSPVTRYPAVIRELEDDRIDSYHRMASAQDALSAMCREYAKLNF